MSVIYLDHASTAPLCPEARDAMLEEMNRLGNPSSAHSAGASAMRRLSIYRSMIASCLGCDCDELIFVSGGTEANALALHGRTHIAVSAIEHDSVRKNAPDALILPVMPNGVLDLSASEPILQTADFVSVQYANNELGTLQPIKELGILCKRAGALLHTDAVQAVGHVPIDLSELPIDLLSLSAHKFGGPVGIGALYVKNGTPLFPLLRGGMQEHGMRAGTESVLLACGMAAALQASVRIMEKETARLQALGDELFYRLVGMGGVPVAQCDRLPSHLLMRFPDHDAEALLNALDLYGICVSAGAACHANTAEPSHVLLALGMTEREAKSCLRISMGRTTSKRDIDALCDALELITKTKISI